MLIDATHEALAIETRKWVYRYYRCRLSFYAAITYSARQLNFNSKLGMPSWCGAQMSRVPAILFIYKYTYLCMQRYFNFIAPCTQNVELLERGVLLSAYGAAEFYYHQGTAARRRRRRMQSKAINDDWTIHIYMMVVVSGSEINITLFCLLFGL